MTRNANDIVAKHLTNALPGDVLSIIDIYDANVVRALPTEIPKVEVRREFTDIMLELADGALVHLSSVSESVTPDQANCGGDYVTLRT